MGARSIIHRAVLVTTLLAPTPARADAAPEPLPSQRVRLTSGPGELLVPSIARTFALPVGTEVLLPSAASALDAEIRRLQELETRLVAENRSLRDSAKSWQPGWKTLLVTLATGISVGVYAGLKF